MTQVNPKTTNIAINAKGGAMTNIAMTILASKVTVMEDPSYNGGVLQGLAGYYIDPQPPQETIPVEANGGPPPQATPQNLQVWLANTDGAVGPAYEPIVFGGEDGRVHGAYGNYVGADGTVLLQLTTNGANAGGIILQEYP